MKYLRRGSGYYIDVGASELVANGEIKLQARARSTHLTEDAVVLTDGTELPADLIVYATGYGSMNGWAADLISPGGRRQGRQGAGASARTRTKDPGPWEGEQRNMWKPTQQEALWFHGGNLHQSRHYSLYLALQLKARMEGIPTPGLRAAGGPPHELDRRRRPGQEVDAREEVGEALGGAVAVREEDEVGVARPRGVTGRMQ